MFEEELLQKAGLTDGEAKVYLALLEIGSSTTGPIIEKSKVARSFIYYLLNSLIDKGLVSYITRDKTKHYQAAEPDRILDYVEKRKQQLDKDKQQVEKLLPRLRLLQESSPATQVAVYEGFQGIQTAFEHHEDKLEKGDEYLCIGGYPTQEEKYHAYWNKHHMKRAKKGVISKMLFNQGADPAILRKRNSYRLCDTRYMPVDIKTPAWFLIYKDTVCIVLQDNPDFKMTEALCVEVVNQQIADSFKAYFEDYWKKSKPFKV